MAEPSPGDQIRVDTGSFYHYGIYIGADEVVQFGLPCSVTQDPSAIRVLRSPVSEFLAGGFLEVRRYTLAERRKKHSDAEIVRCALAHVGEGGYDILHNNCQHFANECVFGTPYSDQADALRQAVLEMLRKK